MQEVALRSKLAHLRNEVKILGNSLGVEQTASQASLERLSVAAEQLSAEREAHAQAQAVLVQLRVELDDMRCKVAAQTMAAVTSDSDIQVRTLMMTSLPPFFEKAGNPFKSEEGRIHIDLGTGWLQTW